MPEQGPTPRSRTGVTVGLLPPTSWLRDGAAARAAWLTEVNGAGIDHVAVGDHVSFLVGAGSDGLIDAATLLASHPTVAVHTGAYLLPLRHPVLVARQLATIGELAPARFTFGVGVGGEDRHEVEVCGVDPARRGQRMDESLVALRDLLAGRATTSAGPELQFRDALVLPAPDPPVPFLIAGRSRAATRRAGRLGDGWQGLWVSARRFADAVAEVAEDAEAAGRDPSTFRHSLNVWCAFDDERSSARRRLEEAMGSLYHLPLERFERWSPFGPPGEVAESSRRTSRPAARASTSSRRDRPGARSSTAWRRYGPRSAGGDAVDGSLKTGATRRLPADRKRAASGRSQAGGEAVGARRQPRR